MSKIILVILLLGGITFWWHWKNTPDPKQQKQLLQKTVIGAVIIGCLLLVVTGRLNWVWAAFVGFLATVRQMLPTIVRYFPFISQLYRTHGPKASAQNSSTVSAKYIEMTLDHQTGKLSGNVLAGEFKNKLLHDLEHDQLSELFQFCQANDIDSAKLLENYLIDRFGKDPNYSTGTNQNTVSDPGTNISISEALQILGLEGNPTNEEITTAYRKIMQQLHPDRGGNQYFAAKVNEARKVLLNNIG